MKAAAVTNSPSVLHSQELMQQLKIITSVMTAQSLRPASHSADPENKLESESLGSKIGCPLVRLEYN